MLVDNASEAMGRDQGPLLESLGLGVARVSVSAADPRVIEVTYYGGVAASARLGPITRMYRSETAVSFPADLKLPADNLELSIGRLSDQSFAIRVTRGTVQVARGLGLTDRDHLGAIIVAWWTEATEPYGVVKYSIRDGRTVEGYYISKMTPDHPGVDIARGDTSHGFCGDYILNSREVSGRTWGPHEWKLSRRDQITDIAWREHERTFCRGFGMSDPEDRDSIIATYIPV